MSLSDEVSSPNGSDSKKLHAPLTEEEKKRRHILSEQKRRGNIRQSFDRLTTIVPDTEGRGRSEMFVLNKTDGYLRDQLLKRKALIEKLEERGITVDEKDKEPLKMLENFANPAEGDWSLRPSVAHLYAEPESKKKKGGGKPSRDGSQSSDEGQ